MTIASAPTKPYAIGETLREWRLTARLSIDDLAVLLHEKAPTLRRNSREFIRRYEIGSVAIERLDVAYLIVIAELLGHDARELGPDIAELVDLLSTVLAKPERPRPRRRGHSVKDVLSDQATCPIRSVRPRDSRSFGTPPSRKEAA